MKSTPHAFASTCSAGRVNDQVTEMAETSIGPAVGLS